MKHRETIVWSIAVVGSLGLHGLLLWNSGARLGNPDATQKTTYRVTRVTFSHTASAAQSAPAASATTPKPDRRRVRPRREPSKPVQAETKNSRPHSRRESDPEQAARPSSRAPTDPSMVSRTSPPASAAKGAIASDQVPLTERAKHEYLARVLARIERHKRYPWAARHRGIEGSVHVSFQLLADGRVSGLHVSGGRRLLRDATETAVNDACPLPRPPEGVSLPLKISFRMVFSLR